MAATKGGAALLEEASQAGLSLLDQLSGVKIVEEGPAESKVNIENLLEKSTGLVFSSTVTAGIGLGFTVGSGFYIHFERSGRWSAPCFVKITSGQAGAILGVEKVSTLMVSLTQAFPDQLKTGRVMDGDVSMQLQPLRGIQATAEAGFSFWGTSDVINISTGKGVLVKWSFSGGAITVDETRNTECYGAGTTVEDILSGRIERPSHMLPLYERIADIIQGRAGHN